MRYSAFISYNHADQKWAKWLHRALETYRVPAHLHGRQSPMGTIGPRLLPVYQDREEMVSAADLGEAVRKALTSSSALIVLCSPASAGSHWVNQEIRKFHELCPDRAIHCLIVGGEPHASRKAGFDPALECFPPALLELGLHDPVAPDVRPGTDGKQAAKLRLLAGLLGVGYDDLRQREQARQQRRLLWIASSSVVAALFTSGLAAYALIQRNEAVEQRDIARQKTLTAERTTDFVKSIFTVSDPSEAKGDVITARDILERGARRLENSLSDEPNVKAQLTTTLAEVYGGLGLYQRSDSLIRDSFSIKGRDRQTDLAQLIALGESQLRLGNYDAAVSTFQGAANRLSNTGTSARDQLSRALGGLTEAYASQDAVSAAEKSGMAALNSSRTTFGELNPSTARAYEALGLNSTFSGDLNTAKKRLEKALAIRLKTQGTLHPKVTELLSGLGSIAYLQREPDQAESYYLRAIASYDAVLGPNHPESATARQNLARVLLDQRKFSEAAPMFREAVATSLKERPATHDDMAFLFANLALAENGLGNLKVAEANFRRALIPARLHTHRNLAPILTDLASTLCAQKRYAEAVPLLDEAAPIMAKTYPNDPWRPAWVAQIRGQCLFAASKAAEGRALIRSSAAAITKRWPAGSLYGHIVAQNLKLAR